MADVSNLLGALSSKLIPVDIQFLWRPQLRDANYFTQRTVRGDTAQALAFLSRTGDLAPAMGDEH